MPAEYAQGLPHTNIVILRKWIDPAELPAGVAFSAITSAELSRSRGPGGDAGLDAIGDAVPTHCGHADLRMSATSGGTRPAGG